MDRTKPDRKERKGGGEGGKGALSTRADHHHGDAARTRDVALNNYVGVAI